MFLLDLLNEFLYWSVLVIGIRLCISILKNQTFNQSGTVRKEHSKTLKICLKIANYAVNYAHIPCFYLVRIHFGGNTCNINGLRTYSWYKSKVH